MLRGSAYYVQFAERPPGSVGRVGVIGVIQGAILCMLGLGILAGLINDLPNWSSLVFAMPAAAYSLASVNGRYRRPSFSLVARVISL
jgi:hypothetical protein